MEVPKLKYQIATWQDTTVAFLSQAILPSDLNPDDIIKLP